MKTKLNKTFIIQNVLTKEQWIADSGKSSWKQIGHAKSAWAGSRNNVPKHLKTKGGYYYEPTKFNDQDEYECIELKSSDSLLLDKIKSLVELSNISKKDEYTTEEILILEIKGLFKE